MNFDYYLDMKPMKYVGGAAAKKHVQNFLTNPLSFKDWFYSLKVDGEWARIVYDLDGNITVQGRGIARATGKQKDNTDLVPHLVQDIKDNFPMGTVLVGELAFENSLSTVQVEVASIMRSKAPRALTLQKENKLHFYVFDVMAYDQKDYSNKAYKERIEIVESCKSTYVRPVKVKQVSLDAIDYLDSVLDSGGEGIMIMHKDGKYLPDSRSVKVSLKIKKELGEITLPVVGLVEPNKMYEGDNSSNWEYKDQEGNLVTKYHYLGFKAGIVVDYKGTLVKITSGINDDEAEWLSSELASQLIKDGTLKADVTAMSESDTVDGGKPSLRHPVVLKIRTDL